MIHPSYHRRRRSSIPDVTDGATASANSESDGNNAHVQDVDPLMLPPPPFTTTIAGGPTAAAATAANGLNFIATPPASRHDEHKSQYLTDLSSSSSSSSVAKAFLSHLPQVLIRELAQRYLPVRDALAFASTSRLAFTDLHASIRIDHRIEYFILPWTSNSGSEEIVLVADAQCATQVEVPDSRHILAEAKRIAPFRFTRSSVSSYSYRIGVRTSITLNYDLSLLANLNFLPVTTLRQLHLGSSCLTAVTPKKFRPNFTSFVHLHTIEMQLNQYVIALLCQEEQSLQSSSSSSLLVPSATNNSNNRTIVQPSQIWPSSLRVLRFHSWSPSNSRLDGLEAHRDRLLQFPSQLTELYLPGEFRLYPAKLSKLADVHANDACGRIAFPPVLHKLVFPGIHLPFAEWPLPPQLESLDFGCNGHQRDDFPDRIINLRAPELLTTLRLGTDCQLRDQIRDRIVSNWDYWNDGEEEEEEEEEEEHDNVDAPAAAASSSTDISSIIDTSTDFVRFQWPKNLTHLVFSPYFKISLEGVRLPPSLQHLEFESIDDAFIEGGYDEIIPDLKQCAHLRTLILSNGWNYSIASLSLPDSGSLRYVRFGWKFNQSIGNLSSELRNLTYLELGKNYRESLSDFTFSSSLEFFYLDSRPAREVYRASQYAHPLPPSLASTQLRELTLTHTWNFPLFQANLPSTLTSLRFGHAFNERIEDGQLPPRLRRLYFDHAFNQTLAHVTLPESLIHLEFDIGSSQYNHPLPDLRHTHLETLILGNRWKLTSSDSQAATPPPPAASGEHHQLHLPPTLTYLRFGDSFSDSLNSLVVPPSLQRLSLPPKFNAPLPQLEHTAIRELILPRDWNQRIDSLSLPAHLESLEFGKSLSLQQNCETVSMLHLPDSLTRLQFNVFFRDSLNGLTLPSQLVHFGLGVASNQSTGYRAIDSLCQLNLPEGVRSLVLPDPASHQYEGFECQAQYIARVAQWKTRVSSVKFIHFNQNIA